MTPQEIVSNVLELLERPDLEVLAFSRLGKAINSAHSNQFFLQDQTYVDFLSADVITGEGTAILDVPPRFRSLQRIETLDAVGAPLQREFANLRDGLSVRNYYGFRATSTYSKIGKVINLFGVDTRAETVRVHFVSYPTYELNPLTQVWETDSWIVDELGALVEAYLLFDLAVVTADTERKSDASAQINLYRQELLHNYVNDYIHPGDL